ncbi:MAG: hypothetical protein A2X35_08120 [Elusimicrobia bacterium GWA2_61_42]|nr:MAG: hypothetical protein A2X35_08120 [Elusimicrobia bacterium GWA2_61_42]OGR79946.1 MAG: hypothetical protein A2X38_02005 [Elusimicrobia bacterium GWC2_61_25]
MENENIVTLQFKLTREKALLLLALFFLCWHPSPLGSETLQLTTYYPAPYGGYVSLLTTGRTLLARDTNVVGIGTGTPNATVKLQVVGGGNGSVDLQVNGRIQVGDGSNNGGMWLSSAQDGFVGNTAGNIGFWTSGVGWNAMQIIKNTGFVGVGTTAPGRRMHVAGDMRIGTSDTLNSGALYGLCHTQTFGTGTSTCRNGTVVTAIYGNECATGGVLLRATGANMMLASSWAPHMAQNCSGTMLCCRIIAGN